VGGGILGSCRKNGRDQNLEWLFGLFLGDLLHRGKFETRYGLSQGPHHLFDDGRSGFEGARHDYFKLH